MESLPRGSETAKQRHISERTRSQRRRNVETNEQTAARLCWHSVIMRVVSVVVRIKLSCLTTTFRR